jgi:hypothetical protein
MTVSYLESFSIFDVFSRLHVLEDVKNKRVEFLRHYEVDTYKAYEWLCNHRSLFKSQVYGPACLEISLADARYAAMVESSLSRQANTVGKSCFLFMRMNALLQTISVLCLTTATTMSCS